MLNFCKAVIITLALQLTLLAIPASAALVDPALIPDGDYVVIVERIVDPKHIIVKMDNGIESEIAATSTLSFDPSSRLKRAKIFVYKGLIITYRAA
ncbi:MAG TPA: hypothetical protein VJP85_14340 [Candidatus Baltobacteraceae bacterium]|nr:hypothetical protein [Candidatus Baltobacteraceae bacterium]